MKIQTKVLGECEIDEKEIITFQNGLPGFEDKKAYILIRTGEDDDSLMWLQSVEEQGLAFVVARPEVFKPDYHPAVRESELAELKLEASEDSLVLVIAVVPEDVKKMTVNLRAPLVINSKSCLAKQVVLEDDLYKIREAVFKTK